MLFILLSISLNLPECFCCWQLMCFGVFDQCRGLPELYCDINVELTCGILLWECSISILYYHMVACVCQYNVVEMLYLDMTIYYPDIKMPYPDFKVTYPDIVRSHYNIIVSYSVLILSYLNAAIIYLDLIMSYPNIKNGIC